MMSRLMESFADEIQKEETQEYINNLLNPYISKYTYIFYLVIIAILILILTNCFNIYFLFQIHNKVCKVS